jgi:hypothetical protein
MEKAGSAALPARAIQQRSVTSWVHHGTQPAVSRRLFRCLEAHLPRSLRSLKILSNPPASAWAGRGDTAPVAGRGPLSPNSLSRWRTSSRCPAVLAHSSLAFVVVAVRAGTGRSSQIADHKPHKQKTLPPFGRQG